MPKTTKNKIVYEETFSSKGKALSIIFPDSAQEIKNLVKLSNHDIIARGNGTSLSFGVTPHNSIIIDFSKMNKILEINPAKKTAVVEPGILLSDLNSELEEFHLEFPVIPLFQVETIGGMIAKNSSGSREIRYNRMMNWTESLEVINGKGEQIKISKSDLSDFVGMEGASGLIIKATLRLTPKKQKSLTILKANTLEDAFSVNKKLRYELDVCSIDMLSREISSLLGLENKYHLFVEFESDKGTFKNQEYEKFMKLKNMAYKKASMEGFFKIENVKFLIDNLQDYLMYLEDNKIPYFCHIASGVAYPLFRNDEKQNQIRADALIFAKKLHGQIGYSFGIGLKNKEFLDLGETELAKRIKNRHDPHWKLNQNKLIDYKQMNKPEDQNLIKQKLIEQEKLMRDIEQKERVLLELAQNSQQQQKKPELSPEEKEKIKKIASGFFSGGN